MARKKLKEIVILTAMLLFVNSSCKGSDTPNEPIDNRKILGTWYGCAGKTYQIYTFNLDYTFDCICYYKTNPLFTVSGNTYKLVEDGGFIISIPNIHISDYNPNVKVDYIFKFGVDAEGEYLKMYEYPSYTNCIVCRRNKYECK